MADGEPSAEGETTAADESAVTADQPAVIADLTATIGPGPASAGEIATAADTAPDRPSADTSSDLEELVEAPGRLRELRAALAGDAVASHADMVDVLAQMDRIAGLVESALAGQQVARVLSTERNVRLHEDLAGVRRDVERFRATATGGGPIERAGLDELCAACLRITVVTLACCVIGGPAAGLVLHQPLLEKAIEGAIIGFVGAAATELGVHMTDLQHQPQIAQEIHNSSDPAMPATDKDSAADTEPRGDAAADEDFEFSYNVDVDDHPDGGIEGDDIEEIENPGRRPRDEPELE